FGGSARELGLAAGIVLPPPWEREVRKLQIGLEAAHGGLECLARDAGALGIRPQRREPGIEIGIGNRARRHRPYRAKRKQARDEPCKAGMMRWRTRVRC